MKFILIVGVVTEGLGFVGPFDTHEEAREYGEGIMGSPGEVAALDPPIQPEGEA